MVDILILRLKNSCFISFELAVLIVMLNTLSSVEFISIMKKSLAGLGKILNCSFVDLCEFIDVTVSVFIIVSVPSFSQI